MKFWKLTVGGEKVSLVFPPNVVSSISSVKPVVFGFGVPMHTFRARKMSRNVDLLASYDHNLLSFEELFCNDTG